jgi:competence protein ComEC
MASDGRETTALRHGATAPGRARAALPFGLPGRWRLLAGWPAAAWLAAGATFEREIEAGRGFLWLPVAFGSGILIYFALPAEPWAPALEAVAVLLVVAAWRTRFSTRLFRVLVVAACVASGLLTAKLRTDWVAAPVMAREATVTVSGWIAAREEAPAHGARLYLRVHDMKGTRGGGIPRLVRVTMRSKADALSVGDAVTLTARLQPPSGAVMPGGYDFARVAYYAGIGAVGFAYGAAKPTPEIGPPPLAIRLAEPLAHLRNAIRTRIEAALPGDTGHVAAALVTGDRGGISEQTRDAMRVSGLAHMLAISGLHMALIAGAAFWLIRAVLALSTGLALDRPIKKWAAVGALAVAAAYLGISGAGIATQRAFVMLAIMLMAVMLDRPAISLRNVALAAFVILLAAPESLTTASFQMSFAATLALVAGYEAIGVWRERRLNFDTRSAAGLLGRVRRATTSLALTSLIGGLATAPLAAFHFQRVAPLTLIANLAAMPVVGTIVMPMALAALVLMPFGLEALPLTVMGWGLAWVGAVARQVAAWTAGHGVVSAMPLMALGLTAAGFLWLALWRERWRLAGLVPMALAVPVALTTPHPDVLIDDRGITVAVRGPDGRYAIVNGKGETFVVDNWLRADGDGRESGEATLTEAVACDPLGCVAPLGRNGAKLAVAGSAAGLEEDCRMAAVVISRYPAPPGCRETAFVVDGRAVARHGAHALYTAGRDASGKPIFRVAIAYPDARRPFMPPPADQ